MLGCLFYSPKRVFRLVSIGIYCPIFSTRRIKKGSQTCAWLPNPFFDRKLFENKLSGLKLNPDVGEILNYSRY